MPAGIRKNRKLRKLVWQENVAQNKTANAQKTETVQKANSTFDGKVIRKEGRKNRKSRKTNRLRQQLLKKKKKGRKKAYTAFQTAPRLKST